MGYAENKLRSKTIIIGDTLTDQAGAAATDINVIVKKMQQTGSFPMGARQPMYVDLSILPDNLRDMLEMSRNVEQHRNNLPKELQHLSTAELVSMDPAKIAGLMTEQQRYNERAEKLPTHLKGLSRQDVLNLTDDQYNNIIAPPQPAVKTEPPK